ncbi:AN1-type zinc finger protein 5 [Caerostris darwini]|uniref:AN1-type zinc finger protein 5 n=1 Tax=Caerostris darwini TaxID=1538125 RepID=A0AAV4T4U2_9ARAC|nr:AN1-type zinc finger protein 5 [Caerostris darwini]
MSDEEKKSDLDAKIVSSTVNNMLSVVDRNDAVQVISAGYEADQSSVQDISDVNTPPNISQENNGIKTDIVEIEELSSGESVQRSSSEALEIVRILYEFPDDSENSDSVKNAPSNKKRRKDSKNEEFIKKSRKEAPNNKGKRLTETDENLKETEKHTCSRNSSKPGKITFASESSLEITEKKNENNVKDDPKNLRSALKPVRRLPKYKEVKNEITSETNPTDFKGHLIQESSSEGTLADVEDNIDSTSNGDISDDLEKGHDGTKTIPESSGGQSSKTISASAPSVDINKESSTRIPIKSASMPLKKNSNLNTSQLSGSEKKMASASSTSQLKIKSDVARHTKRKCFVCNKKLGLTAITCRCGGLYCSQHRYDKEHNCTFDYRSLGAEEIRKNNPLIVAEKIPKL